MGMTGRFDANFSSFYDAVEKAVVELKGFDAATGQVESSLSRMVDNFSGRKIISEATLLAKALDDVGGVAKLTNAELAKIGPTMSEGAEKLRLYGQEVPASIQKYADAAKSATTATTGWSEAFSTFSGVLGAFGVQTSIGAMINYAKEIVATAEQLDKLNAKTGISVETLQRFDLAGKIAGNSLEEISQAAIKLTENLAGDGKASALQALDRLGIKAEEFRRLSLEDKIDALAEALKKIPDSAEQVQLAWELMGAAGVRILPTLKSDLEGVGASAKVMSKDTVDAFAIMSANIAKDAAGLKATVGNMLISIFGGWGAADRAAKALDDTLKPIGEKTLPGISAAFENMIPNTIPNEIDELNNKFDADALALKRAKAEGDLWAKTLGDIHDQQKKLLNEEFKKNQEEIARATKATNQTVIDGLNETKKAQQEYFEFLDKEYLDSTDYQIKKIWDRANAEIASFKGTAEQRAEFVKTVNALADAQTEKVMAEYYKQTMSAEEATNQQIADVWKLAKARQDAYAGDESQRAEYNERVVREALQSQTRIQSAAIQSATATRTALEQIAHEWQSDLTKIETDSTTMTQGQLAQRSAAYRQLFAEVSSNARAAQAEVERTQSESSAAYYQAQLLVNGLSQGVNELTAAQRGANSAFESFHNTIVLDTADLAKLNQELTAYYDQIAARGPVGTPGPNNSAGMAGPGNSAGMPRVPGSGVPSSIAYANGPGSYIAPGALSFGEGGSGDFGSGTLAILHGREAIVPLDKNQGNDIRYGGSAGIVGGVSITVHVTQPLGTPDQIARAVGDAQIAVLKGQGVRLPYGS